VAVTLYGQVAIVGEVAGVVAVRLDVSTSRTTDVAPSRSRPALRWRWIDPEAERRDEQVRAALRNVVE
jgi:hypothetical protein